MNYFYKLLHSFLPILLIATIACSQSLEEQFDQMLTQQYPADEPGATALVAVDGKIVYHKAFGMANMELDVKMQPGMILEIGSITKQFTAVAILMLMEEGKLSLDDDITKYIENYPTDDQHISIHHLLTHTSGIKSYTSMPSWAPIWRTDYDPITFIDFFKDAPKDFAPGEEWRYNNSAYFILGYIIEKASGTTYEDFIETRIFQPLGMESSLYGSNSEIIKNRANGYQKKGRFLNAEYLSLTQPYSAGSLMSNVEDLYIWNRAIRSNKLVTQESIDLAFTNHTLNNGEKFNYGYGWSIDEINESPTIEHAGGIFGYVTNSIYAPDEDVFVAVYSNCDCNDPGTVSTKMAAVAMGKPYYSIEDAIPVDREYLEKLVGVYNFQDGTTRTITLDGNQLFSKRTGSSNIKIYPTKKNTFSYHNSLATIEFGGSGNDINARFSNRINKTFGKKSDKTVTVPEIVEVDMKTLEQYLGVYEVNPGFDIAITIEENKIFAQATGQQRFEIFPESQTMFFVKVIEAKIEFKESETGTFDSFILHQAGQKIEGKRK